MNTRLSNTSCLLKTLTLRPNSIQVRQSNNMEKFLDYNRDRVLVTDPWCKAVACNFLGSDSLQLLSHYRSVHRSNYVIDSPCLFSVACPINKTFKTVPSLHSHLRRMNPSLFRKEWVVWSVNWWSSFNVRQYRYENLRRCCTNELHSMVKVNYYTI